MPAKSRPKLTRETVINAAIRIAETDRLAELSMRTLAADLGFEVMSLYTHVRNKDDLLTGMVECCVEQLKLPNIDDTFRWRPVLRTHALDLASLFEVHPWLVELWLRSAPGPNRFDLMEWQLAAFAVSGLNEQDAHKAYHAYSNHIVGHMLQRHAMTSVGDEAAVAEMISTLDQTRHGHMMRHIDQHRNGDIGDSFEFTLDLLLDGYASLIGAE